MVQDTSQIGTTTIQILLDTRERLKKHGDKDDTWDDIIKRLLDLADDIDQIQKER